MKIGISRRLIAAFASAVFARGHRAGSMVVFAVGRGRRIMGLRKVVLPMSVTHASSQGLWCNGSYGMDQPTSRQGRLVTP